MVIFSYNASLSLQFDTKFFGTLSDDENGPATHRVSKLTDRRYYCRESSGVAN